MKDRLHRIGRYLMGLPRPLTLAAALGWMALIWFSSSNSISAPGPGIAWRWIGNLAHAPTFGILTLLWAAVLLRPEPGRAWPRMAPRELLAVFFVALAYGITDEWHQSHTPGRHPSLTDVLTDMVAAGCVLWIVTYLGQSRASEGGLRWRLFWGVVFCAAVAFVGSVG